MPCVILPADKIALYKSREPHALLHLSDLTDKSSQTVEKNASETMFSEKMVLFNKQANRLTLSKHKYCRATERCC